MTKIINSAPRPSPAVPQKMHLGFIILPMAGRRVGFFVRGEIPKLGTATFNEILNSYPAASGFALRLGKNAKLGN